MAKSLVRKLLHVSRLLGESRTRINFLVDTGAGCNLISKAVCKKLDLEVQCCSQELVGYDGAMGEVVGMLDSNPNLGTQIKVIKCFVYGGKVNPILGLPGLKMFELNVNCLEYCSTRMGGERFSIIRLTPREWIVKCTNMLVNITMVDPLKETKLNRRHIDKSCMHILQLFWHLEKQRL